MDSFPHSSTEPPLDLLIDKYLADECSPAERVEIERWIGERNQHRALLQTFSRLRTRTSAPRHDAHAVNAAIRTFVERRDRHTAHRPWMPWTSWSRRTRLRIATSYSIAATLLIAAILASVTLLSGRAPGASQTTRVVAMREYVTPRGQQGIVTLPDGSRVILNVDSRLRVPVTFGTERRDVFLEGEGHFTVLSHATKPFIVHANGVTVHELGTVFNVRAYRNESRVEVAVADGRVSVVVPESIHPDASVLASGDLAVVGVDGATRITRQTNVSPFTAWTTGRLTFQSTPASEVLAHLGRWYNLEFRVLDSTVAARRIDLTVLDRVWKAGALNVLAVALDARAEQHGRVITFTAHE